MTQEYDRDEDHVKLLGIFHYVMAGLDLLGCGAGAMYLAMAAFVPVAMSHAEQTDVPEELAGSISVLFAAIGIGFILFSLAAAALTAFAGWSLHNRRNRTFVLVVAALHLISIPFGTMLGVFTIIVLSRPEVTEQFELKRRGAR